MASTPSQLVRVGPIRLRLPAGAVDTTRAVYGDGEGRVEVSRFEDPAESPEAYSRERQGRAAELAGTEPARQASMRVDGQPAYLTVYGPSKGKPADASGGERAFLVLALRPGRFARIQFSGGNLDVMRDPIISSIRVGGGRVSGPVPGLGGPESFVEFTMALPDSYTRRTPLTAEDPAVGIAWRMDAGLIAQPAVPPLTRRLPKPPEIQTASAVETRHYRGKVGSGAITTRRLVDPELGTAGAVVTFATVVVADKVLVHVRGDCPPERLEQMQAQLLELLDGIELEEGR